MTGDVLTLQEEVFIGSPLAVDVDELVCDRYGCDASAVIIVPGASLCFGCALEFGIGGGLYALPLDELVGGDEWRAARAADYVERLQALRAVSPRRRDARAEELLGLLAEATLDL